MSHRILVIDDEQMMLDLLATFFEKEDYEVLKSCDSQDALDRIQNDSVDVVILDIDLGDANGLDLLDQIKEIEAELPVIMLTGLGYDDNLIKRASQKGASWYLSKTLPLELLLREVERTIQAPLAPAE